MAPRVRRRPRRRAQRALPAHTLPLVRLRLHATSQKLSFDSARHLRNSSNGNKEVKVGRDGQEIDAPIGLQLLSLFHSSTEQFSEDGSYDTVRTV